MAPSKAAIIGVFVTLGLLYFDLVAPGIAFIIGGIGVTAIYRGIKGCFNFMNPMALTGAGLTVLVFEYSHDWVFAAVSGVVVSVIVGLLYPG